MTKKLADCKFDISENSQEWHSRYNEIIDHYVKTREEDQSTSISSLSDDECILLAMALAKLQPGDNLVPDWERIKERIDSSQVISVPEPEKVTFRVIMRLSPITYEEASLFLSVRPYTWADPEHLSFMTLVVSSEAVRKEHDMAIYEAKAKDIFMDKCLKALHQLEVEHSTQKGLPLKISQAARHQFTRIKSKIKKHWY